MEFWLNFVIQLLNTPASVFKNQSVWSYRPIYLVAELWFHLLAWLVHLLFHRPIYQSLMLVFCHFGWWVIVHWPSDHLPFLLFEWAFVVRIICRGWEQGNSNMEFSIFVVSFIQMPCPSPFVLCNCGSI